MSFINTFSYNKDNIFKERFELISNNYDIIEVIFHKESRTATICKSKKDDIKCFIKLISLNSLYGDEEHIYTILKSKPHKNIIKYYNYYKTDKYCIIINEYIDGYNLKNFITSNPNLNEEFKKNIFKQMVMGIKHLHMNNILHNDIKLENTLIDKNNNIYIIDFDLSIILKKDTVNYLSDKIMGTKNYISPESFHLLLYSKKSDIWSLGVVLFYLMTNQYPFSDLINIIESTNLISRRNIFKYPNLKILYKLLSDNEFDIFTVSLIETMLSFVDEQRPSCKRILNNKWFKIKKFETLEY